ncbi:MAG: hypothetical protein A3J28_11585 [Acidobacteria bacterium RIFCSPLOWO2_12_FULL_60_22]|nr:MAG: hypothetical protein A3J28_11585 [Acidobacteria bacterium RIFCSPLOWO2_12_FULL_60_22]
MHTKQLQKLLGWAGLFCLAWAFAPTAAAKNTLNCTIVDENSKPLAKQEVMLVALADGKEFKRKTNDQGVAEFKGLEDGSYQVRGDIPGYVISKSPPIALSGNTTKPCTHTLMSATFANALFQEVQQLLNQRKFGEAQEKAKKAVELLPNEAGSHYLLAAAYAYQGKETEAVEGMKKAAELNPEKYSKAVSVVHVTALDVQAKAAEAKKDFNGMMKTYEQMLAVADDKGTVYFNMAVAFGRQNKYDEALKLIDKAIELKPQDLEIHEMKVRLQDLYLKEMDKKLEK